MNHPVGVTISAGLDFGQHLLEVTRSTTMLVNSIFRTFVTRSPDFYLELYRSLVLSRIRYCCPVWRPFRRKHLEMLDSVRKRFLRRLQWRCGSASISTVVTFYRLFDEEDMRMLQTLRREDLLAHFLDCRPNSLRSGMSFSPKAIPRDDTVNNHFSWRICRKLNATHPL